MIQQEQEICRSNPKEVKLTEDFFSDLIQKNPTDDRKKEQRRERGREGTKERQRQQWKRTGRNGDEKCGVGEGETVNSAKLRDENNPLSKVN